MIKNVLETLVEVNPDDSSITPRLATSWKQIDKTTWQFSLRKGVKFHDGEDFNADAVIYNIKRLYNKNMASNLRAKFFANFEMEGKALNSHAVEIKTDKPEPILLTLMGTFGMCSPNTPFDKLTNKPIGTGPYKFVKWDAGTQVVYERFDGYWGKQPQVKKATYMWRGESSVRASMVLVGEADLAPEISVQDANRPDMDISYLSSDTSNLTIGMWAPPLNDKRVRMAIAYAIDKDAIRGSVLSKDVIPATQLVVPNIFGYNPAVKSWPYDPERAKQLVEECRKDGVPVDKEVVLIGRLDNFPGANELVEVLANYFKAVGLNIKPRVAESGVQRNFDRKPYPPGPYIVSHQHDNNKGDAIFSIYSRGHSQGKQSHINDPQLDELIDKGQVATGEERRKYFQEAFKLMYENIVSHVALFHMVSYARVGERINFKPNLITNCEIPLEKITFK